MPMGVQPNTMSTDNQPYWNGGFQQYSYQCDNSGRLLSVGDTTFKYDAQGKLTEHKTDKFVRTYTYAANGDVLSESQSDLC
jgi:YD repeat-containing protein